MNARLIGIAHLSNFGLRVARLFLLSPSTPRNFRKIRSVIRPSVSRTSANRQAQKLARTQVGSSGEEEFSENRSLSVTTYFYTRSYGGTTENHPHFSMHFAHKK